MNNRNMLLIAAALSLFGLFVPIVSAPIIGNINLFSNGSNVSALCSLALALLVAFIAFREWISKAIWPAVAQFVLVAFLFAHFEYRLIEMKANAAKELEGNPFAGLAQAAIGSIQLQWGWIVLFAGAGLAVYAAWNSRDGDKLRWPSDKLTRGISSASLALLIGGIAANIFTQSFGGTAAAHNSENSTEASPSGTPAVASQQQTADELQYARDHVKVYDFSAKYHRTYEGKEPGVEFKIKNDGNRTLNKVAVNVVFFDKAGKAIAEEDYTPVLVSDMDFTGENKPLRPNYIWQNPPDEFLTAKSVPSEWEPGKAQAKVTSIEFAPPSTTSN